MSSSFPEYLLFDRKYLCISSSDPEMPYRRRKDEEKKSIRWGQRKLCLTLVQFLTLFWDPKKVPKPDVVYAGAAPGNNIAIVSQLFPEVEFHLYDPRPFKIKPTEKIHIYQQYFTDKTAREWANRSDVYFVSDIRTADYTKEKNLDKNEEEILDDMMAQMRWYIIIGPVHGHFKLRPPYTGGNRPSEIEYLAGYIFKQPWAPQTSTEARLVPYKSADGSDMIMWSCQKYQDQMFHHNVVVREKHRYINPITNDKDNIDYPELLNDWDSTAETQIWIDYLNKRTGKAEPMSVKALSRLITHKITENSKYKDTLSILRSDPQSIKMRNIKTSRDGMGGEMFSKQIGQIKEPDTPINPIQTGPVNKFIPSKKITKNPINSRPSKNIKRGVNLDKYVPSKSNLARQIGLG